MEVHNIVFLLIISISSYSADAYKGKVFDSTPKVKDDPLLTMETNLDEYLSRIDSKDDVVVFPEYGLTSLDVFSKEKLTKYGLEIPPVNATVNICQQDTKSKIISALSCAALEKEIYLVVNLIEIAEKDFYNTNLIFNKKGALIAKYRKINLFEEENDFMKPGHELVTFDTEFGTFGTFTCYDILKKRPALDILAQVNVTNIVYPTAWFSKLPFWASLSVQDGYAKRNGVNLLASSYNAPKNSNGGAGIYQGRKTKNVHIQGISGTSAVVSDIGRAQKGRPDCTWMTDDTADTRGLLNLNIAKQFIMKNFFSEKSTSVIHEALSGDEKIFKKILCSSDNQLCCDFEAIIFNVFTPEDLKYKFVVLSNKNKYACGMVSCKSDDIKSCGEPENNERNFSFLRIEALHKDKDAYDFPSTLKNDLKPVNNYMYCSVPGNATVKLENEASLVAFGVVFNAAAGTSAMFFIAIISLIISRIF